MLFLYNFLQLFIIICFFPFIILLVLLKKKYRGRIPIRLGFGLGKKINSLKKTPPGGKTIWIHALSVGEVTSALPLVRALRATNPENVLIFSVSTSTGREVAENKIAPWVDLIIDGPLDLLLSIKLYLSYFKPQLFILIETDFWPNWLSELQRQNIPAMLVNGRISKKSYNSYQKFRFFFRPIFNSFATLSMQTESDAQKMRALDLPSSQITTLGNLKFDTTVLSDAVSSIKIGKKELGISESAKIWLCGSTHRGEEEIIFAAFKNLPEKLKDIALIIAPRNIDRAGEIHQLAEKTGLNPRRRSNKNKKDQQDTTLLILDTIGELAGLYQLATLAFIGGSLVDQGGHNPLEPAAWGTPTLFGSHMEDFSEISTDLERCGGAKTVASVEELHQKVTEILSDDAAHSAMANASRTFIQKHSGVTQAHIQEIKKLLRQ